MSVPFGSGLVVRKERVVGTRKSGGGIALISTMSLLLSASGQWSEWRSDVVR